MMKWDGWNTFLSLEPLADFNLHVMAGWMEAIKPEAVEIGLENYSQILPKPPLDNIKYLCRFLEVKGIPYVLKDNLRGKIVV